MPGMVLFPLKADAVEVCGGDVHTRMLKTGSLFSVVVFYSVHSFSIKPAFHSPKLNRLCLTLSLQLQ